MPNTLLEDIKTLGYNHEDVLKILKDRKESEGKEDTEKKELEKQKKIDEAEQKEKDKNKDKKEPKDKKLDIDVTKLASDITESVSSTVSKVVSEEIKKQISLLRGSAPRGEEGDSPINNDMFVKKNLYERRV